MAKPKNIDGEVNAVEDEINAVHDKVNAVYDEILSTVLRDGITAAVPVVQEREVPRVKVFIPKNEDDDSGMKVDPYEHVTINDETTLIRRGAYVDVTVPVFLQLRNKYPNI